MKGEVWNPEAYDYSSRQIIYDCITGKEVSDPKNYPHKKRLCVKYEKVGAWVLSDKQASEIMNIRHGKEVY